MYPQDESPISVNLRIPGTKPHISPRRFPGFPRPPRFAATASELQILGYVARDDRKERAEEFLESCGQQGMPASRDPLLSVIPSGA